MLANAHGSILRITTGCSRRETERPTQRASLDEGAGIALSIEMTGSAEAGATITAAVTIANVPATGPTRSCWQRFSVGERAVGVCGCVECDRNAGLARIT